MSDVKNIPDGWLETTLADVVSKLGDGLHGTPKYSDDGDYYFINGNNLNEGKIQIKQDTKRCSIEEYEKYKKNLNSRTILVSINGSLGYFAYYNNEKCFLGKSACYFNVKEIFSKNFIGYQVQTNYFQKYIARLAGGTTIKNVSLKTMREYPFIIPKNIEEQKAIADILTAFDDKIENLQAQNKTLETIAQTIFKEWFGKYQIGDELPEEWRVGKLGEVVKICGGTTPSTKVSEYWDGEINWTSPKDLSNSKEMFLLQTEKKITQEGLKKISSGLLPIGTLLLSSRAPVGYLAIINIEVAINQGYIALLPKQYFSNNYMYLWLDLFMKIVKNAANGSTFLEISKSSFRNIECIIPSKDILNKFEDVVNPIFNKILSNLSQIQTLKKTRDTLLPKLMNGTIRVKK